MIVDSYGYVVLNSPQYNAKSYGANSTSDDNLTEIQNCIDSTYRVAIIGDSVDEVYRHSQTLLGASNKCHVINGELKVSDASIVLLESNLLTGATSLVLTGASTYFKTGDLVCITSNARSIQGGGNAKDRREGQSFTITVSGDNITLDTPAVIDYLTTDAAKIGHTHSSINFKEKTNWIVDGIGIINNNWENLLNVEPTPITVGYAHGNCITQYKSSNGTIKNVTLKKALVSNIAITFENTNTNILGVKSYEAHDKHILTYSISIANNGINIIGNEFDDALFEDGISLYAQATNVVIRDNTIKNCGRYGIIINPTSSNVEIENNNIDMCGIGIIQRVGTVTYKGKNIIKGLGHYSNVPSVKRAAVTMLNADNSTLKGLEIDVDDKTATLLSYDDCQNCVADDILLSHTDNIALKLVNSDLTLQNSSLIGNGINYSVDGSSTLTKNNVTEQ